MYIYIYLYICIYIYIYIYICTNTFIYRYIYTYIFVYVYIYMYMYTWAGLAEEVDVHRGQVVHTQRLSNGRRVFRWLDGAGLDSSRCLDGLSAAVQWEGRV